MAKMDQPARQRSAKAVLQQLESLQRAGVTHLPRASRKAKQGSLIAQASTSTSTTTASDLLQSTENGTLASPPTKPATVAETVDGLRILQQQVCACERCDLASSRTQTVFGVGNPRARFCFLG